MTERRASAQRRASAASPDGRTFTLDDASALLPGDVVVLEPEGGEPVVGQVTHRAGGILVAGPAGVGRPGRVPFARAEATPAGADVLETLQATAGPAVEVGTWAQGRVTVPARLAVRGFSRHTFLCGQSGSGKSYALGVLLEQLILASDLRIVVVDPNGDYERIGEATPSASAEEAARLRAVGPRVLGPQGRGGDRLLVRFASMPRPAQAAVLELDPLADRDEYNLFLHAIADRPTGEILTFVRGLGRGDRDARALGQRLENLGLLSWEIWAGQGTSASEILTRPGTSRVTVLGLSGFGDPREPVAACLDVVEALWAGRESRIPTLLVVDEAHQICPARPAGAVARALVARLVQIAAEGRKYGLWLLLSTQRPSKIHPEALSQCDNLVLMRVNSAADTAELQAVFGFAPPAMIAAAPLFDQGEALVAGRIAALPAFVRMGRRLTHEGGHDVDVPLAAARPTAAARPDREAR